MIKTNLISRNTHDMDRSSTIHELYDPSTEPEKGNKSCSHSRYSPEYCSPQLPYNGLPTK